MISPCSPPLVTDFKICLPYHPSKGFLRSQPHRRPRHYLMTRTRDSTPFPHPTAPSEPLSRSGLEVRAELPGWVVKDTPGVPLPLARSTMGFCVSQVRAGAVIGLFTCVNTHLAPAGIAINVYEMKGTQPTPQLAAHLPLHPPPAPQSLTRARIQDHSPGAQRNQGHRCLQTQRRTCPECMLSGSVNDGAVSKYLQIIDEAQTNISVV